MIREATEADVPELVRMGLTFRRAYYAEKLEENAAQIEKTVRELLASPQARVLVAENGRGLEGLFGFLVFPHYFSGKLIAGEVAWWVEPEARGRTGLSLLREAERIARGMGAEKMQMVSPTERTSELYKRLGYSEVETTFQRSLP